MGTEARRETSREITAERWDQLRTTAHRASQRAYAPYSKYPVGAAALTTTGRVVAGANIENASYGLTLCAECSLIADLVNHPDHPEAERLQALVCVDAEGALITPCGRCRQLLWEFRPAAPSSLVVQVAAGVLTIDELLPHAFGPDTLEQ